jgi:ribose transport system substrate-binding protein
VVAYDAATAEVNAFRNGNIQALIAQDPKQEGEIAMESAAKLIKGQELDKTTITEIVVIDKGNGAMAQKYEYQGNCS